MPKYSENLNLILPDQSENYDVNIANTNNKTIDGVVGNKQDKIVGKGLSTNDFTNEYKRKLDILQNIYKFKGSLSTKAELLEIEANTGDVYFVKDENVDFAWNGLEWVSIGSAINTEELVNRNQLDQEKKELEKAIRGQAEVVTVEKAIPANTEYEIPFSYVVGSNELEVKWFGWPCTKDVDFAEVGEPGAESNKVKFGWQIEPNEILEFRKRG